MKYANTSLASIYIWLSVTDWRDPGGNMLASKEYYIHNYFHYIKYPNKSKSKAAAYYTVPFSIKATPWVYETVWTVSHSLPNLHTQQVVTFTVKG